jgi:hypothetical protein
MHSHELETADLVSCREFKRVEDIVEFACSPSFTFVARRGIGHGLFVESTKTSWVKFYDLNGRTCASLAISHDNNYLVVTRFENNIEIYYLFQEEKEAMMEVMMGSRDKTSFIGRVLLAGDGDNAIMRRVWGLLQA